MAQYPGSFLGLKHARDPVTLLTLSMHDLLDVWPREDHLISALIRVAIRLSAMLSFILIDTACDVVSCVCVAEISVML